MIPSFQSSDYRDWVKSLKERIRSTRLKTVISANRALIHFYWDLGQVIVEKQTESQWGDKVIPQLAKDLKEAFPEMKGLSATNLKYCKRFYEFYASEIGQQAVDQLEVHPLTSIPWGHHILILTKSSEVQEAFFYMEETLKNGWSRNVLGFQLKSQLYQRQGKALTNFGETLISPQSELAQQSLKDPYVFDFLNLAEPIREKDIENQLTANITRFLLELGKGFAFVGRQYHLKIGESDYYLDLLFYHVKLKCYIVLELKAGKFIPEHAGKMNFYLSAVDRLLKKEDDNASIGILLCRDKNNIEVEFALQDINKPMGVSEYQFTEMLPEGLQSSLPTIEEIEEELSKEG